MHQSIAVGRMVDFREDEFYDSDTQKFYRGIFVTARVSEGAEDTWKKVLDGTLTGFSIGGEINEASHEFVKEANNGKGASVRFIKDYDLVELSLVDNPANQLANVLSIQKSASGNLVVKGMAVETKIESVFICENHDDEIVVVKESESSDCPMCGTKMDNAGWFESGTNRAEKVHNIVTKFLDPATKEAAPISSEGGAEMGTQETVTKADVYDASQESSKQTSVPNPSEEFPDGEKIEDEAEATVEAEAEKVADVNETGGTEEEEGNEPTETPDEVTDDGEQISKKIDDLHAAVKQTLEDSQTETLAKVSELEAKIDQALEKASDLETKINEFGESVKTQKGRLAELENSLNKINSSAAFKKSAHVQTYVEPVVQKNDFWGGAFSD